MSGFPRGGTKVGSLGLNVTAQSGSYNANNGDLVMMTGTNTVTLPAHVTPSPTTGAQVVGVINVSGSTTVTPTGGTIKTPNTSGASATINSVAGINQFALFVDDGTNWWCFDGSAGIGAFNLSGVAHLNAGTDTSAVAARSTASPSTGVAFTPSIFNDSEVYLPIAFTTAGTVAVTMGPSTGAENVVYASSNEVAGSNPVLHLSVPKGWLVIVTITGTTVTIGTASIFAR